MFVQGPVQSYQSGLDQESPKKGQCTWTIILHLISEVFGGRQSRPGRSSIIIVHGGRPWTTKPSYARRTNTQHLEKFQVSVAVTKPVTIATNPSSKLPLAVTISIAVEEVNSEPLASTNLGEVIWTSNRFKDLYIKDRSEPEEGKNFPKTLFPNIRNSILVRLTLSSEGVWPVISGLLFDCVCSLQAFHHR